MRRRAISHWRKNRLDRARALLIHALELAPASDFNLQLHLLNNQALVERAAGRLYEALRFQVEAELYASLASDLALIGHTMHGLGITYEMIAEREHLTEYFDRALLSYDAACITYERAGNLRDHASTLNCMAYLLLQVGEFRKARRYSERAIAASVDAADLSLKFECEHTLAQIYLKTGRYDYALSLSAHAARVFSGFGYEQLKQEALRTVEAATKALREQGSAT